MRLTAAQVMDVKVKGKPIQKDKLYEARDRWLGRTDQACRIGKLRRKRRAQDPAQASSLINKRVSGRDSRKENHRKIRFLQSGVLVCR